MYYEISHFFICFICIHFFTFFTRYWVLLEHHGLIKAGNVLEYWSLLLVFSMLGLGLLLVLIHILSFLSLGYQDITGSKKLVENYNQRGRQQTFYHF